MPKTQDLIYWDSCVFLSYINGENDRLETIDAAFEEIRQSSGKKKIATSAISKVEVAYSIFEKNNKKLLPEIESKIDAFWENNPLIEIIELHDEIASIARNLLRNAILHEFGLKAFDAIHMASAEWIGVKELITYDTKMMKYSSLVNFKVCHPHVPAIQQKML